MRRLNFQLVLLKFIFFVPGIAIRWLAMLRLCVCSTRVGLLVTIIVWVASLGVIALTWNRRLVHPMSGVSVQLVQRGTTGRAEDMDFGVTFEVGLNRESTTAGRFLTDVWTFASVYRLA